MTTSELDSKYLTVGELFNAVGRLIETQGPTIRTDVTRVRIGEVAGARFINVETGHLGRDAFPTPDDCEWYQKGATE